MFGFRQTVGAFRELAGSRSSAEPVAWDNASALPDSIPSPSSPTRSQGSVSAPLRWWQVMLWLALPFAFYLIPLAAGYNWSALSPGTPVGTGFVEGYGGRSADVSISVEEYGTGVVYVPFQARLRNYLAAGELPLWNPYEGLGEPFAAQGDGDPYFPFQIVRSLLAYSVGNVVTFAEYYLASVFLYAFLRELGASQHASIFGAASFVLSGALSLHIARPNISDQVSMIPALFWAAAFAMRRRTAMGYVIFAVVAGLHLLGGFIQTAMISGLVLTAFCLGYAWWLSSGLKGWLRASLVTLGVFAFGNGLAAFYLLPQLDAAHNTFNKNSELLAFLAMPYANITAFFFPVLFGPFFKIWMPLGYPEGVDWNNLYAYAGTGLLLLPVIGWALTRGEKTLQRFAVVFFTLTALFLLLRFVSFPPISGVDILPGLGRQSPKHSQGLAVFCLAVAASIGVDRIQASARTHVRWWIAVLLACAASSAVTIVGKGGGKVPIDRLGAEIFVSSSLFVVVALLLVLWLARRWSRLSGDGARILLIAVVVAELSTYIPLGNADPNFVYGRLGVFVLIVLGGLLWALRARWAAAGVLAAGLVAYTSLIVTPTAGLPKRFELDRPPPFMRWLADAAGNNYRTFGILPDYSSIGGIQDISTVGPLAPPEFERFVTLISNSSVSTVYRYSSTFTLTALTDQPYDLRHDYLVARPILDWLGLRYLVLDRGYFKPDARTDDQTLMATASDIRVAYEDPYVRVLESPTAQAKAFFSSDVQIYSDQATILATLRADPSLILGSVMVEAGSTPRLPPPPPASGLPPATVNLVAYRPDSVRLAVDAPSAGMVVLRDSYFPGWRALINGQPADVVRIDGLVRGVLLPGGGHYDVQFVYLPDSFVQGLWVSGATALLLVIIAIHALLRVRWTAIRLA